MDGQGFDNLARAVTRGTSRRGALRVLAAGVAGGVAALVGGGAEAKPKNKPPQPQCCPASHPTLCGLTCTDTLNDPNNCGACGVPCPSGTCRNGICQASVPTCADGIKNGSETGVDCGGGCPPCGDGVACTANTDCRSGTCCGGVCGAIGGSCETGRPGICATGTRQCVADQVVCVPNEQPRDEVCNGLDDDCDGMVDNGFNLRTDVNNCGGCNNVCQFPNATAACEAGVCVVAACQPGFADCDENPANGCETALAGGSFLTDPNNCGKCGQICGGPNATVVCDQGQCTLTACSPGFTDCNGLAGDGCECERQSPATCGTSGECADGACAFYPSSTQCAPATCLNASTLRSASFCTGNGACGQGAVVSCGAGTTCANGQCVPGATCENDPSVGQICTGSSGTAGVIVCDADGNLVCDDSVG